MLSFSQYKDYTQYSSVYSDYGSSLRLSLLEEAGKIKSDLMYEMQTVLELLLAGSKQDILYKSSEIVCNMIKNTSPVNVLPLVPTLEQYTDAIEKTFYRHLITNTIRHQLQVYALFSLLLDRVILSGVMPSWEDPLLTNKERESIADYYRIIILFALLHDIGKGHESNAHYFVNATRLNDYAVVEKHPLLGLEILNSRLLFNEVIKKNSTILDMASVIVGGHHGVSYGDAVYNGRVVAYQKKDFMDPERVEFDVIKRYPVIQLLVFMADVVATIFSGRPYYPPKDMESLEAQRDPITRTKYWSACKDILSNCMKQSKVEKHILRIPGK